MINISELVLLDDIVHLPKETLKEICTNLNTPEDGSISELVSKIWPQMKESTAKRTQVYESCKARIFGGKTSVSWYKFAEGIQGVKDLIIENTPEFNPFEEIKIPQRDSISSEPMLIGAATGPNEGEYYLRYMYKVGVTREIIMDSIELKPRTTTTTLYVNEVDGYIEVRTDPRNSNKIAKSFAQLIKLQIAMEPIQVTAPFGHSAERFADALTGELIDTVGKPNLALDEFTEAQANSVVSILSALDAYFENEDINELQSNLQEARQSLGDDFTSIPFTSLILNGMEKVGMGVKERDLRGTPLYDYLSSSIEHQGCFIQFPVNEDGINVIHTIRVGLQSNSVFFMSQASEVAIDFVRKCVII
ncbi:hypothetical protein M5X06_32025 [Paenibacillus alvei]|uniref:Uncharacterized protein n=1 Tax=Paenibacillus alvei TaxID=44250 RepID=A0ABT4H869_PAEAL|nr:hypothetical protein [Paenibacillus alvei]MCY9765188.1 hypothetical protein [Paenibacillus alvei]MCY9771404.1 hypothetical protein [Paenibacillus alvei]